MVGLPSQLDWATHGSLRMVRKMGLSAGIAFLGLILLFQLPGMVLNDVAVC
jgi:hypothetical protein